jgi:hypothetical protein
MLPAGGGIALSKSPEHGGTARADEPGRTGALFGRAGPNISTAEKVSSIPVKGALRRICEAAFAETAPRFLARWDD